MVAVGRAGPGQILGDTRDPSETRGDPRDIWGDKGTLRRIQVKLKSVSRCASTPVDHMNTELINTHLSFTHESRKKYTDLAFFQIQDFNIILFLN